MTQATTNSGQTLFDRILMVDWSAANKPVTGANSIWIAEANLLNANGRLTKKSRPPINISTREQAVQHIKARIGDAIDANKRIFVGVDFPFGYPAGAAALFTGTATWRSLWRWIAENIVDNDDNTSNRFEVAAKANASLKDKVGPFWANASKTDYEGLTRKKTAFPFERPRERRVVEEHVRSTKTVWQLAGAGSVGSQALLGIARLEHLRRAFSTRCAVWPFDTQFTDKMNKFSIVFGEVYPSIFAIKRRENEPLDAAQVRTVANALATADMTGVLCKWLSAPACLRAPEKKTVIREEGWIVGVGHTEADSGVSVFR
ncbi:MAG: hypothetical protein AAGA22_02495 [Pseudomonadota bacterium]